MRLADPLLAFVLAVVMMFPVAAEAGPEARLEPVVRAAVDRYASSWSHFSLAEYEPLLHARFVFTPAASNGGTEARWDRNVELEIARDLFTGADGAPKLEKWDVRYEVVSARENWEHPGGVEALCEFSIDIERDGKAWTSTNRSFLVLVPVDGERARYQILRWTEIDLS